MDLLEELEKLVEDMKLRVSDDVYASEFEKGVSMGFEESAEMLERFINLCKLAQTPETN